MDSIVQSIFFNKNKFNIEDCKDYLKKNNLDKYKRINVDKFNIRITYNSRIKLQNDNYIRQVRHISDGIKVEYYNKLNTEPNFNIIFD